MISKKFPVGVSVTIKWSATYWTHWADAMNDCVGKHHVVENGWEEGLAEDVVKCRCLHESLNQNQIWYFLEECVMLNEIKKTEDILREWI